MAIHKVIEVLSNSTESWEDVTSRCVEKAAKSVKNIKSAFVQNMNVTVEDGKVEEYRVTLKITFKVK